MASHLRPPKPPRALRRPARVAPALVVIAAITCGIEAVLQAADHGWIGSTSWRATAYHNGAFWAGLLGDWQPNYAVQPGLMFLTYAFLHGGLAHLAGNTIMLFILGGLVSRRLGQPGLLMLYAVSAICGGLGFAALGTALHPMVGSSGALFGLAGAWIAWEAQALRDQNRSLRPVWIELAVLAGLNLAFWLLLEGSLAWEAHLGGLLGGAAFAWASARTPPGGA